MRQDKNKGHKDSDFAVEMRGISKIFGSVVANEDISFQVRHGSIHGIVGENGAGKSTAMKVLYGLYRPTAGEIVINGESCAWENPRSAMNRGIGMVHQHFMLAGPYTVWQNIVLASGPFKYPFLPHFLRRYDKEKIFAKLDSLAKKISLKIDWDTSIEKLPVGVQQKIEILKSLYHEANILILDEPTAVLTPQETTELFEYLRVLKSEGKCILIITHKLKEVIDLTDAVTVFRAGKVTGNIVTAQTTEQELADCMVGRQVLLQVQSEAKKASIDMEKADKALDIRNLKVAIDPGKKPLLNKVSSHVKRGEVVGIAGIEGNGQSELIQALLFPRKMKLTPEQFAAHSSSVMLMGRSLLDFSGQPFKELDIGIIPEDRQRDGLLLEANLEENYLLGPQRDPQFSQWGFLKKSLLRQKTQAAIAAYDIRPALSHLKASALSGGNQQKVIVARELSRKGQFLLCAQPTRGVDVGAIEFIHQQILDCRNRGMGVLLISSELSEVMGLSDRIYVMYGGGIVGECCKGEWDEQTLGLYMGGGKKQPNIDEAKL